MDKQKQYWTNSINNWLIIINLQPYTVDTLVCIVGDVEQKKKKRPNYKQIHCGIPTIDVWGHDLEIISFSAFIIFYFPIVAEINLLKKVIGDQIVLC